MVSHRGSRITIRLERIGKVGRFCSKDYRQPLNRVVSRTSTTVVTCREITP
ncbi:MAG: hypothetical protein HC851_00780 [Acaryochloris sp. RU_4_1]|nr:hypothetical protein [Acaryochloris sp. RU_4_1]NJN38341.1 hypothetical protein [Acaryochloridaceae cyanobacterium CSU_3_4]NJR53582.1 hypothetical protein [Acaryochloris sp. CRU_2_0]